MLKPIFSTLIFFFLITIVSQTSFAQQTAIKQVEQSLSTPVHIDGEAMWTIAERMEHYGVPGVSIAVIKDHKIAWTKTYGVLDKKSKVPVDKHSLFQAGSISKPVAAYGALRLVEQNKVDLEQDVNNFLQSWKVPDNEFTQKKKVALKHLLSHTAGLSVHGFWGYYPGLAVPSLVQVLNGEAPANSDPIVVNKMPEESFRYSGGGYCVMQQMVIDVEKKSYPQAMQDLVLQPLGMQNSTYDQPLTGEQLKMAATGYLPNGEMTRGERHTYPEMAAAGLWTTAEDLARFAIDLQLAQKGKSQKVLSQAMATKMLTPYVEEFIGMGIFLNKKQEDVYFGHGGWDEGFSSEMVAHREKGYGVVVLTNSNHPDFISELIRSVALTYDWDNYVPQFKAEEIVDSDISQISGRYRVGSDNVITIYEENDKLYRKNRQQDPAQLFKVGDQTYVTQFNENPIQFKKNEKLGILEMNILKNSDGSIASTHVHLAKGEKLPFELLEAGDFEQAMAQYKSLLATNPEDPAIAEDQMNRMGYAEMGKNNFKQAKNIFKVNMLLYPKSFNVYDSFAEACMNLQDYELAIINYKKSLELNPMNNNAVEMLKEIKKKRSGVVD